MIGKNGCLSHAAFSLPALAPDPNFSQVSACTPLVDEELSHLLGAIGWTVVHEGIPVDVGNVAGTTGTDKPYGYHGTLLLVPVDILPSGQRLPVHHQSRAEFAFLLLLGPLNDEPLRKLKRNDASLGSRGIIICGRRSFQIDRGNAQNGRKLTAKARLRDWFSTERPGVQASYQDGVVRQIDHRSWPECRHQLALSNLSLRLHIRFHRVSSSRSILSRVLTQMFTAASTSRSERLARNFIFGFVGGKVFNSGLRKSYRSCLAPPASWGLYCSPTPCVW